MMQIENGLADEAMRVIELGVQKGRHAIDALAAAAPRTMATRSDSTASVALWIGAAAALMTAAALLIAYWRRQPPPEWSRTGQVADA